MSIYRNGEAGTATERTPRFYQKASGGDWYCKTREVELGPYDGCIDAQQGLRDYLAFINKPDAKKFVEFKKANAA